MIDLDKLEELARAATPGPWLYQDDSDAYTHIIRPMANPHRIVASGTQTSDAHGEPTGRFIAAANPATMLDLIALIRKQEAQLESTFDEIGVAQKRCEYLESEIRRLMEARASSPLPDLPDCSGDPANCPDNEGYGCACTPVAESANSGTFPDAEVTVDTPEFREILRGFLGPDGNVWPCLIAHIDAHVAQAVARAVEEATKDMVPLSADARSVYLDGFGILDIVYPSYSQRHAPATQQNDGCAKHCGDAACDEACEAHGAAPQGYGELPPLPECWSAGSYRHDFAVYTADQMQDYGRLCLAARQPTPVEDVAANGNTPSQVMEDVIVDMKNYVAALRVVRQFGDASKINEWVNSISIHSDAARQQGRAAGIEEAAKVCDQQASEPECPERAQYCADSIRALNKTGGA